MLVEMMNGVWWLRRDASNGEAKARNNQGLHPSPSSSLPGLPFSGTAHAQGRPLNVWPAR